MKLLIFSPDSYSIFHTDTKFIFGGVEVETGYYARGMANLGVEVFVVTKDQGISAHKIENINVIPHPLQKGPGYWKKRKSFLGRISYRILGDKNPHKSIDQLLTEINPDFIYIQGVSPDALQLAEFCKKRNKTFLLRIAHDMDLFGEVKDEQQIKKWSGIPSSDVTKIIEAAAIVFTQTPFQNFLLNKWFGREGELMFNPIDIALQADFKEEKKYDILWIGKNNVFKRPEKIIELAKRLPERKFCMVFNKIEETSWNKIVAEIPNNVELIESVPADQIENIFRQSKLFVSTSLHEGFANTFLQAAKNSVPVISMGPDPNNMLSQEGAGFVAGDDMNRLEELVEKLLTDEKEYKTAAASSREYVVKFHDKEKINNRFYDILQDVFENK